MQFGRPRVVDRREVTKSQQQMPATTARHEAEAGAVRATRRRRGVPSKGNGAVADLARSFGSAVGGDGRTAKTESAVRGAGGSAMQSLRNSVKGLPRLNREEELALCEDVQRWQRLEKLREGVAQQRAFAMAGDGRGKVGVDAWAAAAGMTAAELLELVERGTGARERLVLSHVRLVMYLAGKRGGRTALSSMDLIQEGAIALHLAVERYDPGRGVRFFTYADWSLRAAFEKAEATQATTIAMPRYIYVQKRRLKAMLGQGHGPQTRKDLAASLDISELQVAKLLRWANDCQSSDRVLVSGGATLGDFIPSAQSSEAFLRRLDAETSMARLLGHLKPQEEDVIIHRYGLFGKGRKSTPAVAAVMGVSRQYVGRVHQTALSKMRASFEGEEQLALRDKTSSTTTANPERLRGLSSKRLPSKPKRLTMD
ncbi:unnamed protein product [Pylaiella littoralis]